MLGSQCVCSKEFERRGARYWNRVFRHGQKVGNGVISDEYVELLGLDKSWEMNIINIAGNYDIGYAGDMTEERLQRFEKVFAKVNWAIRPTLLNGEPQSGAYRFISDLISTSRPVEDRDILTVLVAHLPLHKEAGIYVD